MTAFVIGVLAVYRLALLVHEEAGPFDIFERLRGLFQNSSVRFNPGPDGNLFRTIAYGLECYRCVSIWTALPLSALLCTLGYIDWWLLPLLWPALSGGSILIREVTSNA